MISNEVTPAFGRASVCRTAAALCSRRRTQLRRTRQLKKIKVGHASNLSVSPLTVVHYRTLSLGFAAARCDACSYCVLVQQYV